MNYITFYHKQITIMEKDLVFHVGRLHFKFGSIPVEKLTDDFIADLRAESHTPEFKIFAQKIYDAYEEEHGFKREEWRQQTKNALDHCDYVIEILEPGAPMAPHDWHEQFGEEDPPSPQPKLLIDIKK